MKFLFSIILSIALRSSLCIAENVVRFDGDQVLRFETPTSEHVNKWNEFLGTLDKSIGFDIWKEPVVGGFVDVHVPKNHLETFKNISGLSHSVFVEDLQIAMDYQKRRSKTNDWYEEYHPLGQLDARLFELVAEYENVPGLTLELVTVGQSTQNRTIYGVHFHGTGTTRVGMFWNGAQHAREWIGPATVFYQLERLLSGYGTDSEITTIVDAMDFYVVPVVNVDGYEYTWTTNRSWRKTRSTFNNGATYGTDPNRNWDFEWGGPGSSGDPNSNSYRGPFAFSEPEIQALADWLDSLTGVQGHIDWHSYGQYILSSWGFTAELPADYDDHMRVGNAVEAATRAVNGNAYRVGPSGSTLYPTSGGAKDYTYGRNNIKYTYTVELPGNPGGFELPPEFILPVAQESFAGSLVFCRLLIEEFVLGRGI